MRRNVGVSKAWPAVAPPAVPTGRVHRARLTRYPRNRSRIFAALATYASKAPGQIR